MPSALSCLNYAFDAVGIDWFGPFEELIIVEDENYPISNAIDHLVSSYSKTQITITDNEILKGELIIDYLEADVDGYPPNGEKTRVAAILNTRISDLSAINSITLKIESQGAGIIGTGHSYIPAELVPIPGTVDRYNIFSLFDNDLLGTKLIVVIDIVENVPCTIEIGLVWVGPAMVLDCIDPDIELELIDPSVVAVGPSGNRASRVLPQRKAITVNLSNRSQQVMLGTPTDTSQPSIRSIANTVGITEPLLFINRSDSVHDIQLYSVYGALSSMPTINRNPASDPANPVYSTTLRVEEIR